MEARTVRPEIAQEKLRWRCDPTSLPFHTTDDLTPLDGMMGQERAQNALQLGIEIAQTGYNIYVCGPSGTGRLTAVQQFLRAHKHGETAPPDLCYVYAFKTPDRPRLLTLPAGQGKALKKAMEDLLAALKRDLPKVLASESCQQRKLQHLQRAQRHEQRLLQEFERSIGGDFRLFWREIEHTAIPELVPVIVGEVVPLEVLEERVTAGQVTVEHYRTLCMRHAALGTELQAVLTKVRRLRDEAEEAGRILERAAIRPVIRHAMAQTASAFTLPDVQHYLQEVEEALNDDAERFRELLPLPEKEVNPTSPAPFYDEDPLHEYQVNVIVDNTETEGVPVILETSPTYKNLFGTLEPFVEYGGMWRSDFMGIRAGAIHRANGGYLIFDAVDALVEPIVWATLKRILRYHVADIQPFDHLSLMPSTSLKPDPVPCRVKVIMLGNEELYHALLNEDDAFKRLFKVKADFDTTLPRDAETVMQYARFIRRICQDEQLRPFDAPAVAAIVEWGARFAGRQDKLSARLESIADVLREADYWAGKAQTTTVTRAAVAQALQERLRRVNLMEDKFHELIRDGLLLITTRGAVVGQVNGLALYELEEDYVFGCPMRITAETSLGDTGVVNIEREVDLGDATYNKGVLILSGYLRHAYAQNKPLILSASLCVEQSYEGIAGDSASAAEMYALLSSLAHLPIEQGIAVTGSINQKGQLQPIGGINEKIEGFFEICRMQGLTGTQGVVLPWQNVDDMMLSDEVIAAVCAGQFHLYPIATIDEGLSIVTGIPAGQRYPDGGYPPDSVNGRVDAQLQRFVEQWYTLQHGGGFETGTMFAKMPYARHKD